MRREKTKEMTKTTNSKVKQHRGTQATNATALSLAKEVRSSSTADADSAYFDGRS